MCIRDRYYAEVSHDPIKLGKNADLRFLGGYQRDYYGYDGKMCIRDRYVAHPKHLVTKKSLTSLKSLNK